MRLAGRLRRRRRRRRRCTSATSSPQRPPPREPPLLPKDPTGCPHPGTPSSGGRRWAGPLGAGPPLVGRLGALSPPRGQVSPSRDAPRPGRSGLQRVSGAETAAVEFAARGWGLPVSLLVSVFFSFCLSPAGLPQASTCRTTTW